MSRVICLEGPTDEELLERILGGRRTSGATGEVTEAILGALGHPERPEF